MNRHQRAHLERNLALLSKFRLGQRVYQRSRPDLVGTIDIMRDPGLTKPTGLPTTPEEREWILSHRDPEVRIAFPSPVRPNCKSGIIHRYVKLRDMELADPETA